jgi:hypothetical protein
VTRGMIRSVPRSPQRAHGEAYVQVRVPAAVKNAVIDACEVLGCSLNAWLVEAIQKGLRDDLGLPEPPPAKAGLPTPADMIRQWAAGERVLMPCGAVEPCAAVGPDGVWSHDGMGFCGACGIRVV